MVKPNVSVVIASGAGGEFLFRCLDSLREQAAADGVEVIVVDRCGSETRKRLENHYDFVTLLAADAEARPSVPELRKTGAEHAQGDIVAIIEEHCLATPHWLETIRSSFQEGDVAIGGPILDNNYGRAADWVVYFSEYHNYLPPWPEGDRYLLNGANIAYKRDALLRHKDLLGEGYWEVVLHPVLSKDGRFRSVPEMGAYHSGPFRYGYYISQRYFLSRAWGGTQREKVGLAKRLIYIFAAPVFPFLLLTRIAHRVFQSGQRIGKFFLALPMLIPVVCAYVWGEWLGYLLGVGKALEKVE